MLVEFVVGNHLSFRDRTHFRMSASPIKDFEDDNVFESKHNQLRLLRSAALYGDNASGKSNLIRSLSFMRDQVLHSPLQRRDDNLIDANPFRLQKGAEKRPSIFEIKVIVEDSLYQYGFGVEQGRIISEWLRVVSKRKEVEVFTRVNSGIQLGPAFRREWSVSDHLRSLIGSTKLFLSILGQFDIPIINRLIVWFEKLTFYYGHVTFNDITRTAKLLENPEVGGYVKQLFKLLNLGFVRLRPELRRAYHAASAGKDQALAIRRFESLLQMDEDFYAIKTIHEIKDLSGKTVDEIEFDLIRDESTGSQKIVAMAGPIVETLVRGGIIIIDEFDASLHPSLIKSIVKWFHSSQSNPRNAQLVAALHNSAPLDHRAKLLRRDQQIYFEKDADGASQLRSGYTSGIRGDASYQNDYLEGKIVKVPPIDIQLSLF